MKRLHRKLTYANLVSTLALFLVLAGGGAFAAGKLAKNSVGTRQIRKEAITAAKIKNGAVTGAKIAPGSITGSQINPAGLGTVPSATEAASAKTAVTAQSATDAQHALRADLAGAIAPPEVPQLVGTPGEPSFASGWKSAAGGLPPISFYKDREGIVHLEGSAVASGATNLMFTLPEGYRPDGQLYFAAVGNAGALTWVGISATGNVLSGDTSLVHLDGITFRVQ